MSIERDHVMAYGFVFEPKDFDVFKVTKPAQTHVEIRYDEVTGRSYDKLIVDEPERTTYVCNSDEYSSLEEMLQSWNDPEFYRFAVYAHNAWTGEMGQVCLTTVQSLDGKTLDELKLESDQLLDMRDELRALGLNPEEPRFVHLERVY